VISTTIKDTNEVYDRVIRQYNSKAVIQVLFKSGIHNKYIDKHLIMNQVYEDISQYD
jgi:hypothetical protein